MTKPALCSVCVEYTTGVSSSSRESFEGLVIMRRGKSDVASDSDYMCISSIRSSFILFKNFRSEVYLSHLPCLIYYLLVVLQTEFLLPSVLLEC